MSSERLNQPSAPPKNLTMAHFPGPSGCRIFPGSDSNEVCQPPTLKYTLWSFQTCNKMYLCNDKQMACSYLVYPYFT